MQEKTNADKLSGIIHLETMDNKTDSFQAGEEILFVLARRSRHCAEAYNKVRRTSNAVDRHRKSGKEPFPDGNQVIAPDKTIPLQVTL